MRIAVIDNGINTERAVYAKELCFDLACAGETVRRRGAAVPPASHGTVVADLIRAYAPEAEIGSVQVMRRDERGDVRDVVRAAEWCAGHGVDVVHMSIGTVQWQDFPALERGLTPLAGRVAMLAAGNNEGLFALPCGLPGVWEVRHAKGGQWAREKEYGAWLAVSDLRMPERLRMEYGAGIGRSNSYQAAAFTGCMAKEAAFSRRLERADVHRIIKAYSGRGLVPYGKKTETPRALLSETPVVWIQAQETEKESVYQLLGEFHRNDYYAVLVTDWDAAGFGTLFWQRRETLTEEALQGVAGEYGCDLLLAVSARPDAHAVSDLTARVTERRVSLYREREEKPCAETGKGRGWHTWLAAQICRQYGQGG